MFELDGFFVVLSYEVIINPVGLEVASVVAKLKVALSVDRYSKDEEVVGS